MTYSPALQSFSKLSDATKSNSPISVVEPKTMVELPPHNGRRVSVRINDRTFRWGRGPPAFFAFLTPQSWAGAGPWSARSGRGVFPSGRRAGHGERGEFASRQARSAQRRPWPCAWRTAGHNRRARRQINRSPDPKGLAVEMQRRLAKRTLQLN